MPTKLTGPEFRRVETIVSYQRRKRLEAVRRLMVDGVPRRVLSATIARQFKVAERTVVDDDIPEVNRQIRSEDALISDASIARVVFEERLLDSRRQLDMLSKGKRFESGARVSAIRARVDVDSRLADLQGVVPRGDNSGGGSFVLRLDLEPGDDDGT
jgi:hypothetical protein